MSSNLERLIKDLEYENRNLIQQSKEEIDAIDAIQKDIREKAVENEKLEDSIDSFGREAQQLHEQFKQKKDIAESLRNATSLLQTHLEDLKSSLKVKEQDLQQEQVKQGKHLQEYTALWEKFENEYEKLPIAKSIRNLKLEEADLDEQYLLLTDKENNLRSMLKQLQNRRSASEQKEEAVEAIIEMARVKYSTNEKERSIQHLSNRRKEIMLKKQQEQQKRLLVQQQKEQMLQAQLQQQKQKEHEQRQQQQQQQQQQQYELQQKQQQQQQSQHQQQQSQHQHDQQQQQQHQQQQQQQQQQLHQQQPQLQQQEHQLQQQEQLSQQEQQQRKPLQRLQNLLQQQKEQKQHLQQQEPKGQQCNEDTQALQATTLQKKPIQSIPRKLTSKFTVPKIPTLPKFNSQEGAKKLHDVTVGRINKTAESCTLSKPVSKKTEVMSTAAETLQVYTVPSGTSVKEFFGDTSNKEVTTLSKSPDFSFSPGAHARTLAELKKSPGDFCPPSRITYQSQDAKNKNTSMETNAYGQKFSLNAQFIDPSGKSVNEIASAESNEAHLSADSCKTNPNIPCTTNATESTPVSMEGVEVTATGPSLSAEVSGELSFNGSTNANSEPILATFPSRDGNEDLVPAHVANLSCDFSTSSVNFETSIASPNVEDQAMDIQVNSAEGDFNMFNMSSSTANFDFPGFSNLGSFDVNPVSPASDFDFSFGGVKSPADSVNTFSFGGDMKSPEDGSSAFSFGGVMKSPEDGGNAFSFGGGLTSPEDGGNSFSFGGGIKSPESNENTFSFSF